LLNETHRIINYPSDEKIIETYDMLKGSYSHHEYIKDKEEYDSFLLSVPRRKDLRVKKLSSKLLEYKWAMKQSGVLDEMCCDVYVSDEKLKELETLGVDAILDFQREGALKMLFDEKEKCLDKDAVGRYFFANRRMINTSQIHAFMRYVWQKEAIEGELNNIGVIDVSGENIPKNNCGNIEITRRIV
jgi:hypothetical protein